MSKPAGKCVFCREQRKLTKSHIWPEWIESILPQKATHHEHIVGQVSTFEPKMDFPALWRKTKEGHVATRRPRNTCYGCNGGWMRTIEEAAKPLMPSLLLGQQHRLNAAERRALAAFLCLVSMRIEFSSLEMRAIPAADHDYLRTNFEPPREWKIWIARYIGTISIDQSYMALQIESTPDVPRGVEHCNTQVTTLVIGQLCAHLFRSTTISDFRGYEGIHLVTIWPPHPFDIEISTMPPVLESDVPWLHEAFGRETAPIPR